MSNKDMIDREGKLNARAGPKHDRIGRWLDREQKRASERERSDEARSAANKPEMGDWPIRARHRGGEGSGSCACIAESGVM